MRHPVSAHTKNAPMELSPEERQRKYSGKLLHLNPADGGPSVQTLRAALLCVVDVAEELAQNRPEYAAAATSFSQEVRKIRKELVSSFELGSVQRELAILNELTYTKTIVSIMEERYPEKRGFFTKLNEDLGHAWGELIRSIVRDEKPHA
jgi:hypothetical protein